MKKIIIGVLLFCMMINSGCLSAYSYKKSLDEVKAIKAVEVEGGAGVGIDLFSLDALKQHPVRQTLAAIGDAVLLYGTYYIVEELDSKDSNKVANSRDTNITLSGDNSSVTITGDTTITTTSNTDNSYNPDNTDNSDNRTGLTE